MTMPIEKAKAYVHGKRLVRIGDKVRLLPVRLREHDDEDGDYFARQDYDRQRAYLGYGSFKILRIEQWPCGKAILYLKGKKVKEAAACAANFM